MHDVISFVCDFNFDINFILPKLILYTSILKPLYKIKLLFKESKIISTILDLNFNDLIL